MLTSLRLSILPVRAINIALPKEGIIYEIGSGYGVLAALLAQKGKKRTVIGIDFDESKITRAKKTFTESNLTFLSKDALTCHYQRCAGVVLSDFLHHISFVQQEQFLAKLTKKIKKGGRLIIKEIDKNDKFRMCMSRFWDFMFYPKDRIYYRSKKEWTDILVSLGLTVVSSYEVGWFPGSTTLFICTKRK